ncbi:MAG: hypothetical protein ND895_21545 [Pyrinomonadaceae bacterium]|nr:hypothetical protein [Pyrinomonadaceae bacterium]
MGVDFPDEYNIDFVGGPLELSGGVGVDVIGPVELAGIPDTFHIDITHIPKIFLGVDPLTINPLTINPLDVSVRLKEIPSIRGHVPANFTVGVSVLGLQLFCIRLCGEAQVITEPYKPSPCEQCD